MIFKPAVLFTALCIVFVHFDRSAHADLLVSDNFGNRILRYDQVTGAFLEVLVSSNPGTNGGLSGPVGMVQDADGNLLVASQNTNSVLMYDVDDGSFLGEFASAATGANLAGPADICFGPTGALFVANFFGASVDSIAADGMPLGPFTSGGPGISGASSIEFGPDGNLYVTSFNTGQVQVFNGTSGSFMETFAGSLPGASGLMFDDKGDLRVASLFSHQISEFSDSGNTQFSTGNDTFPSHILANPNDESELLIALTGAAGVFRFSVTGTPLGPFATGGGLTVPGQSLIVSAILVGDVNGDGIVDLLDVAPFVEAVIGGKFVAAADINQDGVVNLQDVAPFVALLI